MKKNILFALLLSNLYASPFSVIIEKPFDDALYDVTENYDRSISAIGFSRNYPMNKSSESQSYTDPFEYLQSVSGGTGSQMHLVKLDGTGNILLSKATNLSQCNEALSVLKTPDNGYFVGGHTLGGVMLLFKLDANANIVFQKEFGTHNHDKLNKLVALGDGGVLAIGTSTTSRHASDPLFVSGLGMGDITITRFSKYGEMLWSKKYGTAHDDRGVDAIEAYDGSIILVGSSSNASENTLLLFRLGDNGDKYWHKEQNFSIPFKVYKLIQLRDASFLLSLSQNETPQKEQIRLLKFDIQKNIILDKKIPTNYPSALKDIAEFTDGTLMGVGYVRDGRDTNALAMTLDTKLNKINMMHYGGKNLDQFNALEILHNSEVAVVGIATAANAQESNMWIAKLTKDGKMSQSSTGKTPAKSNAVKTTKKAPESSKKTESNSNLFDALIKIYKDEIAAKEIIIGKDLSIEVIEPSLLFKVGEFKLTDIQKKFLDRFGTKLMRFMNDNKARIGSLEVNGHTSSEWGGVAFKEQYLNNEKLSLERAYAVLSYVFTKQSQDTQKWLSEIIVGSGYSFSKKVVAENKEDFEKSRRVSFKVIEKK